MVRKLLGAATMTAGLALASPQAAASLIGDQVSASTTLTALSFSPATATVMEGPVEFVGSYNIYPQSMRINVEANSVNFLGLVGVTFVPGHSVTVSDLDFTGAPGGITGISVSGVDPSRISYTTHSVTLDIGLLPLSSIDATVTFQTAIGTAIPEPASALAFGAGLVGLVCLRRTRQGMTRPEAGPLPA